MKISLKLMHFSCICKKVMITYLNSLFLINLRQAYGFDKLFLLDKLKKAGLFESTESSNKDDKRASKSNSRILNYSQKDYE